MVLTSGQDGDTDMFWKAAWNMTYLTEQCVKKFGVQPSASWVPTYYTGLDLSQYSNIFFSNG
jgi:hypothetical protein